MRVLVPLALSTALLGCGKTVTDEDCKKISDNLREIWQSESQKASVTQEPRSDKAAAVIKTEGDKLVAEWSAECKKELEGRRVDPKEVDCLLAARTIEQVNQCS